MSLFKRIAACGLCLLLLSGMAAYAGTSGETALRPIHITVTDARKNPVAGLKILIVPSDGEAYTGGQEGNLYTTPVTGEDGRCEIAGHETGRRYALTLSNPYRPSLQQTHTFQLDMGQAPYLLQLSWEEETPETSLRQIPNKLVLHFVDEKGAPENGLLLFCEKDTFFTAFPEKFFTGTYGQAVPCGPDGCYVLLSPSTGSYTVTATYAGSFAEQTFSVPYLGGSREYILPLYPRVPDGEEVPPAFGQPAKETAIRVIDAAGNAVPDAVVSAEALRYPKTAAVPPPLQAKKTGRDGIRICQAPPSVTYKLRVQNNLLSPAYIQQHELFIRPYGERQPHTVVFDGEPPLTTLEKMEEKTVLFFYYPSKVPAAGLQVTIQRADNGKQVSDGWTDYEGKYLFLRAEPAEYILHVCDEAGRQAFYTVNTSPGGSLRFEYILPE